MGVKFHVCLLLITLGIFVHVESIAGWWWSGGSKKECGSTLSRTCWNENDHCPASHPHDCSGKYTCPEGDRCCCRICFSTCTVSTSTSTVSASISTVSTSASTVSASTSTVNTITSTYTP
ncbi:small cysteine-rich protein 2-like [Oculina patagonica]